MAGMVGEFGRVRRVPFQQASRVLARRGGTSTLVDRPDFRLLFVGNPDAGLHVTTHVIAAVCGSAHTTEGDKVTARRLLLEYQKTGSVEPKNIRGHFSFVLADLRRRTLMLCRDALAVTPLHTLDMGQDVVFSTEYKAILDAFGFDRDLDLPAIDYFLRTGWTPPGRTFFSSIKPLPAGQVSLYSEGGVRARVEVPNWSMSPEPKKPVKTSQLSDVLTRSVHRFLEISGSNIGVMLSGGIDSALIAALLRHARPQGNIHSLTVGYGENDPEIIGARSTATALGLEHSELILSIEELEDLVPASIWAMENVGGHDEYPCLFGLALRHSDRLDSLFSGNLSDTLFAGMQYHRNILAGRKVEAFAANTHEDILYQHGFEPIPVQPMSRTLGDELFSSLRSRDERMSAQEIFASHARSELMLPYGDQDVIEVALRTPDEQKLNPVRNKIILRDVASQVLPSEIADRPKGIQQLPYDGPMQSFLLSRLNKLAASEEGASTLVRTDYVSRVALALRTHCDRSSVHRAWNVMALDYWCRIFLSHASVAVDSSTS